MTGTANRTLALSLRLLCIINFCAVDSTSCAFAHSTLFTLTVDDFQIVLALGYHAYTGTINNFLHRCVCARALHKYAWL